MDPNKKLSNINEYVGDNDHESPCKNEEVLHADDDSNEDDKDRKTE